MTEETKPSPDVVPNVEAPKPVKAMEPVVAKGGAKIFPDKRLPHFDQGDVKAYEALGADGVKAFAMICEGNIVPQTEIVHKYAAVVSPHIPKLIDCTVVNWSLDFKEHFVFIYEDKLGNPISKGKNPAAIGLKAELVAATIFRNLLDILQSMHDKGIPHGGIRVQNLFDGGSSTYEKVMLGEMLSAPSGYGQPVIYETIPRSLATPLGRGMSEISDDIYALGVLVATLLRTHNPAEGLSDEEIISHKIEVGSFNFIAGKDRFPASILEFMRGTLNDDPNLRWTFDDILTWADGRRVTAKLGSGVTALKSSRPLDFNRKKFFRPQSLAIEFSKNSAGVVPLVENGELFLWLNRSLQNKEVEKLYEEAIEEAKRGAGGSNYADRLACAMSIALAPENPILYRGLKFIPTGFGNLLINAIYQKKDVGAFVDIIQGGMISFWSKANNIHSDISADAVNRIVNCKRLLNQTMIGYGLERCIYYLSPMSPCLSEKLDGYYVRSAEDYMNALEGMSAAKNRPDWFFDRHIVAFLSVRDKSIIEPFLADISASEKYRQRHGVLKVFASIQSRDKMPALPGLSAWISSLLDILIERYHDREKRKRIKSQLEKIKDKGDLVKIAALFDNYDDIQMDMKNYAIFMQQYQALKAEHIRLENELDTNPRFGMGAGQQTATLVSGLIAALVVILYLIVSMTSSGGARIF